MGRFHFVTVRPSPVHGLGSHVNIKVEHHRLGSLQTCLGLKKSKMLTGAYENPEINATIAKIATENNIPIYDFEIVISGESMKEY